MYSCAIFERPDMTLAEASQRQARARLPQARARPGDHVLEIGTGWGGFALHAAGRYGCRVTTTTISPSRRARRRAVRAAGLEDRITVLLEDYRDLRAVRQAGLDRDDRGGRHRHLGDLLPPAAARCSKPRRARCCCRRSPSPTSATSARRDEVDFIQRYIFPGGLLPSVGALTGRHGRGKRPALVHLEDIGPHYATTLRQWREQLPRPPRRGARARLPDTFIRMWEFYLCYCEAGFAERALGDVQMVMTREG